MTEFGYRQQKIEIPKVVVGFAYKEVRKGLWSKVMKNKTCPNVQSVLMEVMVATDMEVLRYGHNFVRIFTFIPPGFQT